MGRGFSVWTLSAQGVCFGCGLYSFVFEFLIMSLILRVRFLSITNRLLCVLLSVLQVVPYFFARRLRSSCEEQSFRSSGDSRSSTLVENHLGRIGKANSPSGIQRQV